MLTAAGNHGPAMVWISGLYPAMATRMPSVMTSAGVHPLPGGANGPVDDESIGAGHPVMMTKVMTSRPSSHRGQTRPRPGEHDQGDGLKAIEPQKSSGTRSPGRAWPGAATSSPRPGEHDQGGDEFTATRRALRDHPVAQAIDDFSDDHR